MALTTKQIQSLKPRESRYSISDGNGLTLRVQPSGSKSWVFRSHHSGRITDETIGHWPEMSLKQARMIVRRRRKDAGLKPPSGYVLNDAFRLWCGLKKGRIVQRRTTSPRKSCHQSLGTQANRRDHRATDHQPRPSYRESRQSGHTQKNSHAYARDHESRCLCWLPPAQPT